MPGKDLDRNPGRKSSRSFGEAPVLGKVSRSPQSAVRRGSSRRQSSRRSRNAKRKILAWSLLLAFLAAGVLITFTFLFFSTKRSGNGETAEAPISPAITPSTPEDTSEKSIAPSLKRLEVRDLVVSAMTNRDPSKIEGYFTLGSAPDPNAVIEALETIKEKEGEILRYEVAPPIYANGTPMERVIVHLSGNGKPLNRLAQLVPTDDGSWKIDFDSYMRACDPDWETILSGEAGQATVRVFIVSDNYYNHRFADDSVWQSYAMVSPDIKTIILGYARLGSPQHRAIERILANEDPLHRVTLKLEHKGTEETRQFEIISVLAEDWVLGETPYDEDF